MSLLIHSFSFLSGAQTETAEHPGISPMLKNNVHGPIILRLTLQSEHGGAAAPAAAFLCQAFEIPPFSHPMTDVGQKDQARIFLLSEAQRRPSPTPKTPGGKSLKLPGMYCLCTFSDRDPYVWPHQRASWCLASPRCTSRRRGIPHISTFSLEPSFYECFPP